ncbi:MAG: flavin reductase family protein [Pyrinomonadaceae bacterium]
MPVNSDDFRAALSRFASGVTVVTTKDANGKLHGLTVSAFCSVSLEPPMILVCIEKATASHYAFAESEIFTVSILNDSHVHFSEHFATELVDKFEAFELPLESNGLPAIEGATAVLNCKVRFAHDGGDHTIFVADVENTFISDNDPLIYFRSEYRNLSV